MDDGLLLVKQQCKPALKCLMVYIVEGSDAAAILRQRKVFLFAPRSVEETIRLERLDTHRLLTYFTVSYEHQKLIRGELCCQRL